MSKTLPLPGEVFDLDECEAFVIRSDSAPAEDAPWVWYAPTLPQYPDQNETWMFEQFMDAGISICGIDVGESWGSPNGRRAYSTLYDHLVGLGYSRRPALLPRSRGGLMLYNWAAENASCVTCVAAIYPVCHLCDDWLELAVEPYGLSMEQVVENSAQHNPVERLGSLAEADVPIYHIHGDVDDIVPVEIHSTLLAERYRALGGHVTVNVAEGQGHSLWEGFFQCQELVDFVIGNVKGEAS